VGTFVVKDFLDELLDYEPDLFVVYVGHNEFYGVYGPASSVGTTVAPWLTQLSIYLNRFKVYLALRDILTAAQGQQGEQRDGTLMEQMSARQAVPYMSETYEAARGIYARNIEALILAARKAGVPIMFSALVSNLADQPPFLSENNPALSPAAAREFSALLHRADGLLHGNDVAAAAEAYRSAVSIDSMHAGAWFGLGQAYRHLGDSSGALECLTRARDLDALRFRMSGEFQEDLRTICRSHEVIVSPADSAFASSSPGGLVGNGLILEHLHPNTAGYTLLARSWARSITSNSLLGAAPPRSEGSFPDNSSEGHAITAFDSAVGRIRTAYLTRRWPFPEDKAFRFTPEDAIEGIALRYVQKKIPWQSARYEAADFYIRQKQFLQARREASAVASVIPFSYEPWLRIADYYLLEGKRREARDGYLQSIEAEENPYAWSKLALLHLEDQQFNDVILALNNAFAAEGKTRYRLPPEAVVSNRYLLGYAYAKLQKRNDALRELKRVVALDPHHKGAKELLSILEG
jgi:tetratricopeptide (TPR) repeat protein